MRKLRAMCGVLAASMIMSVAVPTYAAISGDEPKTYEAPFLITNAGQGPGGKMCRLLVSQAKTVVLDKDYFYNAAPVEKDLDERDYSCLVVVIGSTDKGLGASGITIEDELKRLDTMVKHAEETELPIVAVLLEKDKRSEIRTNANERCIDAICPHAEWMIVVAEGNKDGRFDELKKEYDIPLTVIDTSLDFIELAKTSFVLGDGEAEAETEAVTEGK